MTTRGNEENPAGRAAIVTGAGGGIGRAVVAALLDAGARVLAVDIDLRGLADDHREEAANRMLGTFECDLSAAAAPSEVVAAARETIGPPQILVNNAARIMRTDILACTEEEWNAQVAVNLKAAFFLSQCCAAEMKAAGWGRIVNLSSQAGHSGGAVDCPIYAVTKGGLNTMTRSFARALAPHGITVNALAPGIVMTDMIEKTLTPERIAEVTAQIPIGRASDASEIAATVCFLCSDRAASITGHVLDINGGMLMR